MAWWRVVVAAVCVARVGAQDCRLQEQCGDCVQLPGCMWCPQPKTTDGKMYNCIPNNTPLEGFCDPDLVENPENVVEVLDDEPLTGGTKGDNSSSSSSSSSSSDKIVQLKPQRVRLTLRRGVTQRVSVVYRQATDYPLDLYYLMDLSNSMRDDKERLALLGTQLADTMKALTTQFRLGFGSFVDKVLMPYTDTAPNKLASPCDNCAPPYAFRNDLSLTSDHNQFTTRVEAAKISGNLDAPEGGFDALMQVMVCSQIGWQDQVRRIVVFSTDAKFHHAGDGRLAGIVEPNDERCHLDDKGEYQDYDKYDYPSVAQINKVAKEKNINIIFAVSSYADLYEELAKAIETSSYGALDTNSNNVVSLVKEQYEKITSKVMLSDNLTDSSPVSIRYTSSCLGSADPKVTQECSQIKEGDEVTFHLDITADKCPADGEPVVVEVKTLQDKLILEIEFDCECGCDSKDRLVNDTDECHGQGAMVCGVCSCFPGYRGANCMCTDAELGDSDGDVSLCIAPNDTETCSGHGKCTCGACNCDEETRTGKYCQCNERLCLVTGDGSVCSGRGTCVCDGCKCNEGFVGDKCECEDDNKCKQPGSGEICSGRGNCVCGKCKCDQSRGLFYTGTYCEDCQTCASGKCVEFRNCVQCKQFNSGQLSVEECGQCDINPQPVDVLDDKIENNARLCTFEDETTGCYFNFTYLYREEGVYDIHVQREQQCPEPAPVLGIVFGLVAAIVAIGVLTLIIWKVLTTVHDRREFAKFEDERRKAQWNQEGNPLYKPATNTFQNPAFSQQAK